ncbi:MAG: hypothetical protein JSR72_06295 [Proteobacteria bacterium]|nr:hypothetical protein [Pseudomonadota bacterium]
MPSPKPFIIDDMDRGVTRTAFRRMKKAQKRQLIIEWFGQNYEDPAVRTPFESREGGYQYIWGDPRETRVILDGQFGGLVSEALIEEVAKELENDGPPEWVPIPRDEDYEHYDEADVPTEPPPLDIFLDEQSDRYGSSADLEARRLVEQRVNELLKVLEEPAPIGIGHNQPPTDISIPQDIREAALELRKEITSSAPEIGRIKQWATPLRDGLVAIMKYVAQKADKAVDAAVKATAVGAVTMIGLRYSEQLERAFDAVVSWLEIAAKTVL